MATAVLDRLRNLVAEYARGGGSELRDADIALDAAEVMSDAFSEGPGNGKFIEAAVDGNALYILGWVCWYRARDLGFDPGWHELLTACLCFALSEMQLGSQQDLIPRGYEDIFDRLADSERSLVSFASALYANLESVAMESASPLVVEGAALSLRVMMWLTDCEGPDCAAAQSTLGHILIHRSYIGYPGRLNLPVLRRAIAAFRTALQTAPPGPEDGGHIIGLAKVLQEWKDRSGETYEGFDELLHTLLNRLSQLSVDSEYHPSRVMSLANLTARHFEDGRQEKLGKITEQLLRPILPRLTRNDPDRAIALHLLGSVVLSQQANQGSREAMTEAAGLLAEALELTDGTAPHYRVLAFNLAAARRLASVRADTTGVGQELRQASGGERPSRSGGVATFGLVSSYPAEPAPRRYSMSGSGCGFDWAVPYAPEAIPRFHPALMATYEPGHPDRLRALWRLSREAQHGGAADCHHLGVACLFAHLPFTAMHLLLTASTARPEGIAAKMDFATAAARAGRLRYAENVVTRCLLFRLDAGMDEHGTEAERFIGRIRQLRDWQAVRDEERRFLTLKIAASEEEAERFIGRIRQLREEWQAVRDEERRFLAIKIAASEEAERSVYRPTETEAVLAHAQTLMALGELEDSLPPYQRAVELLEQELEVVAFPEGLLTKLSVPPRVPGSAALLEALAEARLGCGPSDELQRVLSRLRDAVPGSPVLRAARRLSHQERQLRDEEAHHEAVSLWAEFRADPEGRVGLEATLRRRCETSEEPRPYLMVVALIALHRGDVAEARSLALAFADRPKARVSEHVLLAEEFRRYGAEEDARRHVRGAERAWEDGEREDLGGPW